MNRHLHMRRARKAAPFRWSRIPVESRDQISAVEYRLFDTDDRGQLHREHVLLTDTDNRAAIAASLIRARRRLRARVEARIPMIHPAGGGPAQDISPSDPVAPNFRQASRLL